MAKLAYVDCFSGLSGDMFLGALVDAGLDPHALRAALAGLPVDGYELTAEPVTRQSVAGHAVRVRLSRPGAEPERHLADVVAVLDGSNLEPVVRAGARRVFQALAEAEARVHGVAVESVHFHEVGAVDAIVDIVGVVWGLRRLGIERVYASAVPTGSGTVRTSHGPLPVPAPATLALLAAANAPLRPGPGAGELVTPTGAALLATLAEFRQPNLRLERVGYGFGQKTFPWPNVVRLWLGEDVVDDAPRLGVTPRLGTVLRAGPDDLESDTISVVETNLDDERPNVLGATMDALLAAGALDVFFTPIQMKKNRPAVKLTALGPPGLTRKLSDVILRETATLGVRVYAADRLKARRSITTVRTPWGDVRVKVKEFDGRRRAAPEYDDCRAVAARTGVPLNDIYQAALLAAADIGESRDQEERSPEEQDS